VARTSVLDRISVDPFESGAELSATQDYIVQRTLYYGKKPGGSNCQNTKTPKRQNADPPTTHH
jgi:hypothetical protein